MDYSALKTELLTDPLSLGLVGATDLSAADKLNSVPASASAGLQENRDIVPSWEIFEAVVPSEWAVLSAAEKQRLQTMLSMGSVNLNKPNTRAAFIAMFGAATTSRANLIALQNKPASRASVLFGKKVEYWDVARARAL